MLRSVTLPSFGSCGAARDLKLASSLRGRDAHPWCFTTASCQASIFRDANPGRFALLTTAKLPYFQESRVQNANSVPLLYCGQLPSCFTRSFTYILDARDLHFLDARQDCCRPGCVKTISCSLPVLTCECIRRIR